MNWNKVAQCVGLWLAEGDNKTQQEITFTNSQPELIVLFNSVLRELFGSIKVRVYSYAPDETTVVNIPIKECIVRNYIDKRANRPYFI
jgi:hypothetical protein